MNRSVCLVSAAALTLATSAVVHAAPSPTVIIFGGGWGPEGTQHSIELQVSALVGSLTERRPTVLFAAGSPSVRAVQISGPVDEPAELLGLIFNQRRDLRADYRPTRVQAVGAASRAQILLALDGSRGTRAGTVVFGVGHGSAAEEGRSAALELWGPDEHVTPESLAMALDTPKRRGPTAFVLGQCHSGAFTAVSHREGRPTAPLAAPRALRVRGGPRGSGSLGLHHGHRFAERRGVRLLRGPRLVDGLQGGGHRRRRPGQPRGSARLRAGSRPDRRRAGVERHALAGAPAGRRRTIHRGARFAEPRRNRPAGGAARAHRVGPRLCGTRRRGGRAQAAHRAVQTEIDRLHGEYDMTMERFDVTRNYILDRVLSRWPELSNPYHPVSRLARRSRPRGGGAHQSAIGIVFLAGARRSGGGSRQRILELEKRRARLERWLRAVQAAANERLLRRRGGLDVANLDAILACEALIP